MTDPAPPEPDPTQMAWDPDGDQLAAVAPVTVTSDAPSRGAQHTA